MTAEEAKAKAAANQETILADSLDTVEGAIDVAASKGLSFVAVSVPVNVLEEVAKEYEGKGFTVNYEITVPILNVSW